MALFNSTKVAILKDAQLTYEKSSIALNKEKHITHDKLKYATNHMDAQYRDTKAHDCAKSDENPKFHKQINTYRQYRQTQRIALLNTVIKRNEDNKRVMKSSQASDINIVCVSGAVRIARHGHKQTSSSCA